MHISEDHINIVLLRYYGAVLKAARSGDLAEKVALTEHGHPLRYVSKRQACLLYAQVFGSLAPVTSKRTSKIGEKIVETTGFVRRKLSLLELARYACKNLGYGHTSQATIQRELSIAKKMVRVALLENMRGMHERNRA